MEMKMETVIPGYMGFRVLRAWGVKKATTQVIHSFLGATQQRTFGGLRSTRTSNSMRAQDSTDLHAKHIPSKVIFLL